MAFSRFVFTVLLLSVACRASNVPVFIWGDLKIPSADIPIFNETPEDFSRLLAKTLSQDQVQVLFLDETLSVEDFSVKNKDGGTNFPYLKSNVKNSLYLPYVQNPILTLASNDPNEVEIKLSDIQNAEIDYKNTKKLTFILDDAQENEPRSELLQRHNDFMKNMMHKLKRHHEKVVGIYTAYTPSWIIPESHVISKRQAEEAVSGYYNVDGLRMYAEAIRVRDGDKVNTLGTVTSSSTNFNGTVMNTTLNFADDNLVLNFKQKMGYWFFDSITVTSAGSTEELFPVIDVYALMDFSYRCAQNVTFAAGNSTKSITLQDLKVQPYFEMTNSTKFGESFNCVGFFSAPIWAGLFVVFILLAITFYGIIMMMDIRTMDRFDDPKGKTITITAAE